MKTLNELLDPQAQTWKIIQQWFTQANNAYQLLAKDNENAGKELIGMQLSTKMPLGAIVYETGGILVDDGWLRIIGSGNEKLARGLFEWNFGKTFEEAGQRPLFLLVADDVVGGYFAINGGGIGDKVGMIYYYSPLKQKWESIGLNYSQFLGWALTADLNAFYHGLRWQNWQTDIVEVKGNQMIHHQTKQIQPIERHYQATFFPEEMGYVVN